MTQEMNMGIVQVIVAGVLDVVRRHFEQTGEILTDEQAHKTLLIDLQDGQSTIAQEFIAKGWPLPQ